MLGRTAVYCVQLAVAVVSRATSTTHNTFTFRLGLGTPRPPASKRVSEGLDWSSSQGRSLVSVCLIHRSELFLVLLAPLPWQPETVRSEYISAVSLTVLWVVKVRSRSRSLGLRIEFLSDCRQLTCTPAKASDRDREWPRLTLDWSSLGKNIERIVQISSQI